MKRIEYIEFTEQITDVSTVHSETKKTQNGRPSLLKIPRTHKISIKNDQHKYFVLRIRYIPYTFVSNEIILCSLIV